MKQILSAAATVIALLALSPPAFADVPANPALRALEEELQRSMKELALPGLPRPYFISYTVHDQRRTDATGTFGALVHEGHARRRELSVEVRVGDPALDNTNYARGYDFMGLGESLPLEDDPAVLRHEAWAATDRAYKKALEMLEAKKAHRKTETAEMDEAGSFSSEPPVVHDAATPLPAPDGGSLATVVRSLSSVFREFSAVQSDTVSLGTETDFRAFLSSEGARVTQTQAWTELHVSCTAQADDGMKLAHGFDREAHELAGLPAHAVLLADVRRVAGELTQATRAPLVHDVTGPVLFDGSAAPVIVGELLAVGLSGTPPEDSEAFARFAANVETGLRSKLGQAILPRGFRVVDDPTIDRLGKEPLFGGYAFDDEGVAAQKVVLVDDGVLKTLLMSRAPIKEIRRSNGHGLRGAFGGIARGQVANLVVSGGRGLGAADLRKKLLAEIRAEGAPHGYVVREFMDHGDRGDMFASTRSGPRPLVLTEVDADGKERVVRGGSLEALAFRTLKDIVATGKDPAVWSGTVVPPYAGGLASSFGTTGPVSIAAPALLFKEVEVKKHTGAEPKLPVAAHPFFADVRR